MPRIAYQSNSVANMAKDDQRNRVQLDSHEYQTLAAFRYALRSFMHFSESAAEGLGLTSQQYQAMLAVRGSSQELTINDLARQLLVRHNTAVGLVDRLTTQGLIARHPSSEDGRQVHLRLTTKGERMLERLAAVHREELRRIGPQLDQLLQEIARATGKPRKA